MPLNKVEQRLYDILADAHGLNPSIRNTPLYTAIYKFLQDIKKANDAATDRVVKEDMERWQTRRRLYRPQIAPPVTSS